MWKILNNSKGSTMLFTLVLMVFLIPFAIWLGIELPKMHEMNQRAKDAVDSASASAVTRISEKSAPEMNNDITLIDINDDEARKVAEQIFSDKLGIDFKGYVDGKAQFEISNNSIVKSVNDFEVWIYDVNNKGIWFDTESQKVKTLNGTEKLKNSSVVVQASVTFKKIGLFGGDMKVTHVGVSQAYYNEMKVKQ